MRWHLAWLSVPLGFLVYIWWHRADISTETLFFGAATMGVLAGMGLYGALKDVR